MELLVRNYNLGTIDGLMCRNLMNINWNGQIYDCDFNQQLDLQCRGESQSKFTILDSVYTYHLSPIPICNILTECLNSHGGYRMFRMRCLP